MVVVRFVVTGFGRFCGVEANPTEFLVEKLPEYLEECGKGQKLYLCSVLKVSAKEVDQWLTGTSEIVAKEFPEDIVVWLHLGVDPGEKCLAIEHQAINCATFLSPDEDGCTFMDRLIDESDGLSQEVHLSTDLDVTSLVGLLTKRGFLVRESGDAGRFVCNWIYFRSLQQSQTMGNGKWHSLFVHVPYFTQISEMLQLEFLANLIDSIEDQLICHDDSNAEEPISVNLE